MSKLLPLDLFIRQALLYPLDSPFLPPENKVLKDYSYAAGRKTGSLICPVWLDNMEYPNNAAAQLAYVSSKTTPVYDSDFLTGGVASGSSNTSGAFPYANACDDNEGTIWATDDPGSFPEYWQYDLGAGTTKIARKLRIKAALITGTLYGVKNFTLKGSHNDIDWIDIHTDLQANNADWQEYTFSNSTAYRYYRISLADSYYATQAGIAEIEIMESYPALQCYSESTIVQQGTHSLKGVAAANDSLNETLTRAVSPLTNWSGKNTWTFYIRSSRTGSNIKVGLHDAGGVTTEVTPNVTSAGAWQKVEVDISGVADADKDAIDQIKVTIVEAGAKNIFYLDNVKAA